MINIRKALELYLLLRPYLDDEKVIDNEMTLLGFASKIVNNVIERQRYRDLIEALEIMTDKTEDELLDSGDKLAEMFLQKIIDIDFIGIILFFDQIFEVANGKSS